jgi:hypothetical protein
VGWHGLMEIGRWAGWVHAGVRQVGVDVAARCGAAVAPSQHLGGRAPGRAGRRSQQGGAPVGPDDGDAVAPLNLQVCVLEQQAAAVAVRHVLADGGGGDATRPQRT